MYFLNEAIFILIHPILIGQISSLASLSDFRYSHKARPNENNFVSLKDSIGCIDEYPLGRFRAESVNRLIGYLCCTANNGCFNRRLL